MQKFDVIIIGTGQSVPPLGVGLTRLRAVQP